MISGLEFSGFGIAMGLFGIVSFSLMIILIIRFKFKKVSKLLSEKYSDKKWQSPLEARTKYPDVNGFSFSKQFLLWGFIAATTSTLLAINWAQSDYRTDLRTFDLIWEEDFNETIRTAPTPPQKLPPPIITKIIELPNDEVIDEEPTFVDNFLAPTESDFGELVKDVKTIPPPPPPPPIVDTDKPLIFAEQMPRFPVCDKSAGSKISKDECSKQKLLEYIYNNLKFPSLALQTNLGGTAVVQFTVGKEGKIEDVVILRDPGAGLGDAAKSVVESMNKLSERWTPGRQQGRPVRVQYTLPIKFKVE